MNNSKKSNLNTIISRVKEGDYALSFFVRIMSFIMFRVSIWNSSGEVQLPKFRIFRQAVALQKEQWQLIKAAADAGEMKVEDAPWGKTVIIPDGEIKMREWSFNRLMQSLEDDNYAHLGKVDITRSAGNTWALLAKQKADEHKRGVAYLRVEKEARIFLGKLMKMSPEERAKHKDQARRYTKLLKELRPKPSSKPYSLGELPEVYTRDARLWDEKKIKKNLDRMTKKYYKDDPEGPRSKQIGTIDLVLELNGIEVVIPVTIKSGILEGKNGYTHGVFAVMPGWFNKDAHLNTTQDGKRRVKAWNEHFSFSGYDGDVTGAIKMAVTFNWMKATGYREFFTVYRSFCQNCKYFEYKRDDDGESWGNKWYCALHEKYLDEDDVRIINDTIGFSTAGDLKGKYRRQTGYQFMTTNTDLEYITDGRNSIIGKYVIRQQSLNNVSNNAKWHSCKDYAERYSGLDLNIISNYIEPVVHGLDEGKDDVDVARLVYESVHYAIKPSVTKETETPISIKVPVSEHVVEEIVVAHK